MNKQIVLSNQEIKQAICDYLAKSGELTSLIAMNDIHITRHEPHPQMNIYSISEYYTYTATITI